MTTQRKYILNAVGFICVIAIGTYLLFDIEALTPRELKFIDLVEAQIAGGLNEDPEAFFPSSGRLPSKFQMGGSPPKVYKIEITTGRRGRRLTFDLSVKRSAEKAFAKFEGRWIHELRANRLGTLDPIELKTLDPTHHRLAKLMRNGKVAGAFFLAQRGRSLFGLTLKGIRFGEFTDLEQTLVPILDEIAQNGAVLMLDE